MSSTPYDPLGTLFGSAQTEYYNEPAMGVPGQQTFIAEQPVSIISYPIQGNFVAAGSAVSKGTETAAVAGTYWNKTSPYTVTPLAAGAGAADVLGLAVWDQATRRNISDGRVGKGPNMMQGVMKKGFMIVHLYADSVADAAAFVVINATNSVNAAIGEIVPTDLGGAAVAVPGITWYASYTAATSPVGIVKVDL